VEFLFKSRPNFIVPFLVLTSAAGMKVHDKSVPFHFFPCAQVAKNFRPCAAKADGKAGNNYPKSIHRLPVVDV
jgi:hypothetical protein